MSNEPNRSTEPNTTETEPAEPTTSLSRVIRGEDRPWGEGAGWGGTPSSAGATWATTYGCQRLLQLPAHSP
eukprot:15465315-Alexandrium_andersonii.AAC.1